MYAPTCLIFLVSFSSPHCLESVESVQPFRIIAQSGVPVAGSQAEPLGEMMYATMTQSGDLYLICQSNPVVSSIVGGKLVPLIQSHRQEMTNSKGGTSICELRLESRPGYGGNNRPLTTWGPDAQVAELGTIVQNSSSGTRSQSIIWWGKDGGRAIEVPSDPDDGANVSVTLQRIDAIVFVDSKTIAFSGAVNMTYPNGNATSSSQRVWIARAADAKAELIIDLEKPPGGKPAVSSRANTVAQLWSNQRGTLLVASPSGEFWTWDKGTPRLLLSDKAGKENLGTSGNEFYQPKTAIVDVDGRVVVRGTTAQRNGTLALGTLDQSGTCSDIMRSFDVDPSPGSGPEAYRWSKSISFAEHIQYRTDSTGKHMAFLMDELYADADGKEDEARTWQGLYVGAMPGQLTAILRLAEPASEESADSVVGSISDACIGAQGDIWILGTIRPRALGFYDRSKDVQAIWHWRPGRKSSIVFVHDGSQGDLDLSPLSLVGPAKDIDGGGIYVLARVVIDRDRGFTAPALLQIDAH